MMGREMMRVDLWLADADARPLDAFRYRAASALGGGIAHVRQLTLRILAPARWSISRLLFS